MKLTEKNSRPHEGPFHEQTWAFEAPAVNWMLDYWNALRRDRSCPAWSDVDLLSIYKYARLMTVKDAICGNDDFVVRFWGTEIVNVLQYDATREKISEYYPKQKSTDVIEVHRLALLENVPVRRWGKSVFPNRELTNFETIHLPLFNDAGERVHVITLTAFGHEENKS